MKQALLLLTLIAIAGGMPSHAAAHSADFKSPGPGMHFTQGQPLVIFADLFDSRDGKGFIACPQGQSVSNTSPPPSYSDPPRQAQCSGGGTPTGWPAFQIFIDGALQTDRDKQLSTIPNTTAFNHDINPDPIGFFRFSADSSTLDPGPHQLVVRGMFSMNGRDVTQLDSAPLTIYVDAPPAKTVMSLSADFSGSVNWDDVTVVGNGHAVTASGSLVIRNSLVTGVRSIHGSVSDASIEGSTFEDTGALDLTLGDGKVSIVGNEFRANNRLSFAASDPSVPFIATFKGDGANAKLFQGNRVGAGQLGFGGQAWLIGGDADDQSNILIGPRAVLNVSGSKTVIRGNYSHHNYRGAWSQGFNFYYVGAAADTLTEHNFIRDGSWPLQDLAGEFRYNVVYGYGHTWLRTARANAVIHHNLFAPGGDGGLNAGIECYGGEQGLSIYNNTFDGGGRDFGDFAGATVDMSGGSQVSSFRNNLVTFSRDMQNNMPGSARVIGGKSAYLYADYNAFYSPDSANKANYDFSGAGAHDASDGSDGQLAENPFAGARIKSDDARMIESLIDEAAIWQRTQTLSQVLALFRERYAPKPGSPIVDSGDPADDDAQGRHADIGAIDLSGHDRDELGKFSGGAAGATSPATGGSGGGGSGGLSGGGGRTANAGSGARSGSSTGSAGDRSGASTGGRATGGDGARDKAGSDTSAHASGGCNCSVMRAEAHPAPALMLALAAWMCLLARRALLRGRRDRDAVAARAFGGVERAVGCTE